MKSNSKNSISLISFLTFVLLFTVFSQNASALNLYFGDGTYTNGSQINTFPILCDDLITLPLGGTLTFEVYASGDLGDNLYLSAVPLPAGATFPIVQGLVFIHSTFTWTPPASFSGAVGFTALSDLIWCDLNFDWPLPIELSSFTSLIHENDIHLSWQTTSENNNSRFEIEKSKMVDGNVQEWIQSGSAPGNGTTSFLSNYTFIDRNLNSGIYKYRLKQIDHNGNFKYYFLNNSVQIGTPERFELSQNYPNPFNPETIINYNLTIPGEVSIKVYNSSGVELTTLVKEFKDAGFHTVTFNGRNLASGVYYYKLASENFVSVKKMTILK